LLRSGNKLRYKAVLFFVLVSCTPLFAYSTHTSFHKPFVKPPVVYQGSYFGFSDHGVFSITDAKDQTNWTSKDKAASDSPLFVHFNHVLFINDQNHLTALDRRFGQKVWSLDTEDVVQFKAAYPQLIYVTKGNGIGALDLMSGRKLWQKLFAKGIDDFSLIGQSGMLGVMTGTDLVLLFAHNGADVSKVGLPKVATKIVASWNNGLILGTDKEFYTFLLNKNTITKSDFSPTANSKWADEHYYVTYTPANHTLQSLEAETNRLIWIDASVPTGSAVFYALPYVIAQTPSKNLVVYQLNRTEQVGGYKLSNDDKMEATRQLYVDQTDIYMVSTANSIVLPLGKKKQSRWTGMRWSTIR